MKGNKMAKFFDVISLVSTLLLPLKAIIQSVELAFPESGQGASKFKIVLDTVNAVLDATGNAADTVAAAQPVLTTLINSFVAIFNASGVFKK
jgi:hypothetical protein